MATTTRNGPLGNLARTLNQKIDCEDLAIRLGMEQPGGRGNFRSPHHPDKAPSVSIYRSDGGNSKFQDHSMGTGPGTGGGPVDLMMWHSGMDFTSAVKELARMYGFTIEQPAGGQVKREETLAEFVARQCVDNAAADANPVFDYLRGRAIEKIVIEQALKKRTLGLNLWNSDKVDKGTPMWGGPAIASIVISQATNQVVAVDMRYIDAEANGGQKSGCQGEKHGYPWTSDWRRVEAAKTVYIVESPINAMSVESCFLVNTAAVATRGTGNVENIDWTFLRGKSVVICMDNDKPMERGPDMGYAPGLKAAWRLHELLTGLDVSALMVDQTGWFEDTDKKKPINDLNDFLQLRGKEDTTIALRKIEPWLIPGLPAEGRLPGKARIWFPGHDFYAYTRYRAEPDFTRTIEKTTTDEAGNVKYSYNDVCGFRIAAVSRVAIASPTSTMTGDKDHAPATVFALSVQTARHGPKLQRRVVDDEKLHNLDVWKKLGPVFSPAQFSRLVNLWERAADIGGREAVNFVGLAYRDGKPVVNEGPDCFFADPRQQCPYYGLTFPSGQVSDGREVLQQFQATFTSSAAAIALVWALGGHLKAFLGFWPHFVMQAEKETGKSTLVKRMERALAMSMFSRQSIQTEFRLITSISYTSHPVGWEELSAGKQDIINKAVSTLQESYQYTHTRRGAELMDFLLCAPVLLAGEDVPVKSLVGKVVRTQLTKARRGPLMDEEMPVFPLKQWLVYLAKAGKAPVQQLHEEQVATFKRNCVATSGGSDRMVVNYAAIATAWHLLCDFLDLPVNNGGFLSDLTAEMNLHVAESTTERQPWIWIIEKALSEISSKAFRHPYLFDTEDETPVLCIRTGHIMDHISQSPQLREFWDHLPVKTDRALKNQLATAGALLMKKDAAGAETPLHVERQIHGLRVGHMVCISLPQLQQFGLHASVPVNVPDEDLDMPRSTSRRSRELV